MELPRVRRYRKDGFDRLYVNGSDGTLLGWSDTFSGETQVHVPGAEERVEAALEAWANTYPEDDIATHQPGRHTSALVKAWDAEIQDIERDITQLQALRDVATYQRDQYAEGTTGEHRVGGLLNKLHKHGWGVLHSISVHDGAADLDHLLIGPGGIWTVNSKRHADGRVTVNGDTMMIGRARVDYVRAARREAELAEEHLKAAGVDTPVESSVVLDGPRDMTLDVRRSPRDVDVFAAKNAFSFFSSLPKKLGPTAVNAAFATARKPSTWGA